MKRRQVMLPPFTMAEAQALRSALAYHTDNPSDVLENSPADLRVWRRALKKVDLILNHIDYLEGRTR